MAQDSTQSRSATDPRFDHSQADLCVACGLCLPVCPTYRLTRDENESPRGRLSLIRALASGQLAPDQLLAEHLHRCTLCLSCESVCPANVGFEEQMSQARNWLQDSGHWPHTLAEKFLLNSLRKGDAGIKRVGQLARIYQRSPLRRVLRGSGLLRMTGLEQTDAGIPAFADMQDIDESYPAIGAEKGRVSLFKGCLQNQTDPDTLVATIRLLTNLGYSIEIPSSQNCCGGLHYHSGDHEEARQLAHKNVKAFEGAQTILGVASGCGAVLKNYGQILGKAGESTALAYHDITSFLAENEVLDSAEFFALPAKVLVHEPCSHRNQLKQNKQVYDVLGRIPGLEIAALPDNQFCCGGAGAYSLSEPELASKMREPKLDAIAELRPDYLVTTNIGCALHLKSGLAMRNVNVELLHPVTLLANQLQIRDTGTAKAGSEPLTADMV